MEISSSEIGGKLSSALLVVSIVSALTEVLGRVKEIFAISPVRMSVAAAGIPGKSAVSVWVGAEGMAVISIFSPVILSIELITVTAD